MKSGYNSYPRKISATDRASQLSLGKSTTIELLRKAKNTVIQTIGSREL